MPASPALTVRPDAVTPGPVWPSTPIPDAPSVAPAGTRYYGIGLFIASGMLGAAALGLKLVPTLNDPNLAREIDNGRSSDCIEFCYLGPTFNPTAAVLWVHAIGLLGAGLHKSGRWRAYGDRTRGIDRNRAARASTIVGFSLVATGVAALTAFQLGAAVPALNAEQSVTLTEVGWWTSIALGHVGAGLAGWGTGYRRKPRADHSRAAKSLNVAPLLGSNMQGVMIAGRW